MNLLTWIPGCLNESTYLICIQLLFNLSVNRIFLFPFTNLAIGLMKSSDTRHLNFGASRMSALLLWVRRPRVTRVVICKTKTKKVLERYE